MPTDEIAILASFSRFERHAGPLRAALRALGLPSTVLGSDARTVAEAADIGIASAQELLADIRSADPARETALLANTGMAAIPPDDPRFPPLLREIHDPPLLLFVRGNAQALVHPLPVAIVGTRKPTPYGIAAARGLSTRLSAAGIAVVSGLALGIDNEAHCAALDARGTTVAVLGSGVDDGCIGPRTNLGTARRIVASGGALVSEYPPGTGSAKHRFPMRNRIIAGMSRGTIVVEAAEKSGALITARAALEGGRDVFAVPGPFTSPASLGANLLIGRGAVPVCGWNDVIEWYAPGTSARPDSRSETGKQVLAAIAEGPMPIDAIAERVGLSAEMVAAELTHLELDGRVKRTVDRYAAV